MNFEEAIKELDKIDKEINQMFSEAEVKEIFDDCVHRCNIIPGLKVDNAVFGGANLKEFNNSNYKDREVEVYGYTNYIYKNKQPYGIVSINGKLYNKETVKYLVSVIYHELAHIIDLNNMYDKGILAEEDGKFYFQDDVKDADKYKDYLVTNGHGKSWQDIANKINTTLQLVIPITQEGSQEQADELTNILYN